MSEMEMYEELTFLSNHPFNMESLLMSGREPIRLVGSPGDTKNSVEAMLAAIRLCLSHHDEYCETPYLRVILAEAESSGTQHYVFFEYGCNTGIYICGGCTDFSGGGKGGKDRLECVFAFLSYTLEIPIDRVNVPYSEAKRLCKNIDDMRR